MEERSLRRPAEAGPPRAAEAGPPHAAEAGPPRTAGAEAGARTALPQAATGSDAWALLSPLRTEPPLRHAVLPPGPGQGSQRSSASLKVLQTTGSQSHAHPWQVISHCRTFASGWPHGHVQAHVFITLSCTSEGWEGSAPGSDPNSLYDLRQLPHPP